MRFAGRPSWRASLDLPQHLHLAVFVRDAYRLAERTGAPAPTMPGRLPQVPDLSAEPGAPTPGLAYWASWWQEVLAADRAARSRQPLPGSPPDDYARAALQRHAIVDAPDFPSLAERPELQRAAQVAFHPFRRWWSRGPDPTRSTEQHSIPGFKGELVDLIDTSPGLGIVNETVRRIEQSLDRRVAPFIVDIDVLGTAGPEILVQEDDYALVSSVLVSDPQRFGTWLERMLFPLAWPTTTVVKQVADTSGTTTRRSGAAGPRLGARNSVTSRDRPPRPWRKSPSPVGGLRKTAQRAPVTTHEVPALETPYRYPRSDG